MPTRKDRTSQFFAHRQLFIFRLKAFRWCVGRVDLSFIGLKRIYSGNERVVLTDVCGILFFSFPDVAILHPGSDAVSRVANEAFQRRYIRTNRVFSSKESKHGRKRREIRKPSLCMSLLTLERKLLVASSSVQHHHRFHSHSYPSNHYSRICYLRNPT